MKSTFFIHTTGCRANQWDSSVIAGNLQGAGYAPTGADRAEIVVINACTVTEGAVRDIRRFINRLRRENPGAKVVLAGCHGQAYPHDSFGADLVLGQAEKLSPDRYAAAAGIFVSSRESLVMDEAPEDPAMTGKTRFFFKIQDGCDRFCSYCIVPYARGAPRSRPLRRYCAPWRRWGRRGVQEVVLTGSRYRRGTTLGGGTASRILSPSSRMPHPAKDTPQLRRPPDVRYSSIETAASSRKLAGASTSPCRARQTACPRPCGAPIVRRMRGMIDRILARMPDAGIGMDVIAGFPVRVRTSSEETRAFPESCPVYYLHVFPIPHGRGRRPPSWTEPYLEGPRRPG